MSLRPSAPASCGRRAWRLAPALLAAGCALSVEPTASGIRPPLRFVAAATQPEAAAAPDPAWWQGFASPELDRLMALALAGNLDVAAAVARLRQADAQLRIAEAQLLPFVDGSASVARARGTNANPGTPSNAGRRYGGDVVASWEIDFWGRLRAQRQAARDTANAFAFDIGAVTLSTQASLASTLFDLYGARERLAVQQGNLAIAERTLAILRQRLAAGTATGLDVAQQETEVAQQRAQIPPIEQTIAADSFALATLAGVTPEEVAVSPQRLAEIRVPAIAPGLPSDLLQRRPDVRAAEASLAAANADVTAARAALFPTISLSAEGGLQSIALQTLLRPGATFYSIGIGVTRPIFAGGRLEAQVEDARGRQEELLALYRRAILAALQDVETALSAFRQAAELVRLQQAREAAASRAFAVADAQLRAGTIDLLTLLSTQVALFNARLALAQARTQRLQAASDLFTALGGGWTDPRLRLAEATPR
jgi:NodT family efflux transporter outer membrane factor (OMF) lipoprotein